MGEAEFLRGSRHTLLLSGWQMLMGQAALPVSPLPKLLLGCVTLLCSDTSRFTTE